MNIPTVAANSRNQELESGASASNTKGSKSIVNELSPTQTRKAKTLTKRSESKNNVPAFQLDSNFMMLGDDDYLKESEYSQRTKSRTFLNRNRKDSAQKALSPLGEIKLKKITSMDSKE